MKSLLHEIVHLTNKAK